MKAYNLLERAEILRALGQFDLACEVHCLAFATTKSGLPNGRRSAVFAIRE